MAAPTVAIKLVQALFQDDKGATGKVLPYVVVAVGSVVQQTNPAREQAGNAFWNETLVFPQGSEMASLAFFNSVDKKPVGESRLKLADFPPNKVHHVGLPIIQNGARVGELQLEIGPQNILAGKSTGQKPKASCMGCFSRPKRSPSPTPPAGGPPPITQTADPYQAPPTYGPPANGLPPTQQPPPAAFPPQRQEENIHNVEPAKRLSFGKQQGQEPTNAWSPSTFQSVTLDPPSSTQGRPTRPPEWPPQPTLESPDRRQSSRPSENAYYEQNTGMNRPVYPRNENYEANYNRPQYAPRDTRQGSTSGVEWNRAQNNQTYEPGYNAKPMYHEAYPETYNDRQERGGYPMPARRASTPTPGSYFSNGGLQLRPSYNREDYFRSGNQNVGPPRNRAGSVTPVYDNTEPQELPFQRIYPRPIPRY